MSSADLCEDGPYELERWRRIARMTPPAQLLCLEAADEIIQSGLLGPEWKLEQVGQHDATDDQRIVKWRRFKADSREVLTILPPIKASVFECQIGIYDDVLFRAVLLRGPKLWGSTATQAVTGALAELDQHLKGRP